MFIQTEQTPNPSTLKFLPGRVVMDKGTMDFSGPDAAQSSPLAKRLFAVEGVERVFFGADFVTVTKATDKDWQVLKPSILGGIMEHYTSGEPVIAGDAQTTLLIRGIGPALQDLFGVTGVSGPSSSQPKPVTGIGGVVQIARRALCSDLLLAFETRSRPAHCIRPLELRSTNVSLSQRPESIP